MIIFTSLTRYIFIETKLMLILSSGSTTSGSGFLPSSLVFWWAPPSPGSVWSSDWPAQEGPNITTLCELHISLTYFVWVLISTIYPAYCIQQARLSSTPYSKESTSQLLPAWQSRGYCFCSSRCRRSCAPPQDDHSGTCPDWEENVCLIIR